MAVPKYHEFMLPLLRMAADGEVHALTEAYGEMIRIFRLKPEDTSQLKPSGKQTVFENRIGWALTYLRKALLIESPKRAAFRITQRGRELLATNPEAITVQMLRQYPEFAEFSKGSRDGDFMGSDDDEATETPEESLESSYRRLRHHLAQDLLQRIKQCSPRFFERAVVDLLLAMGYGGSRTDAGHVIGQPGDGGVDGVINQDRLGLDVVYVQAKRWDAPVGRQTVQAFAGSLEGQRAKKGVLITTSQFTDEAREYVSKIEKRIVLVDGQQLAQLMIDFGIGVTEVATYVLKRIDSDYFEGDQ